MGAVAVVMVVALALSSCSEKKKRDRRERDSVGESDEQAPESFPAEEVAFVRRAARPGATTGIVAVGLGQLHGCALRADGRVACWGDNSLGQVLPQKLDRHRVRERMLPADVPTVTGARDLVASSVYTCAAIGGGVLRCWGSNVSGELGGTGGSAEVVIDLRGGFERGIAGHGVTCGVAQGKLPSCLGEAGYPQPSHRQLRTDKPRDGLGGPFFSELAPLAGPADLMQWTFGGMHACGVSKSGEVSCWGRANFGQLGVASNEEITAPRKVPGLENIVEIEAGYFGNCARDNRGRVLCWGRNEGGQLGFEPDTESSARPRAETIQGLPRSIDIAVGSHSVCSLGRDRSITCWGGHAADAKKSPRVSHWDATKPSHSLVQIKGINDAVALAVSSGPTKVFACALTESGRVFCWGDNTEGQLGDGGTADGKAPVEVVLP